MCGRLVFAGGCVRSLPDLQPFCRASPVEECLPKRGPYPRSDSPSPARLVGTAGVPPFSQSGPPYILLNLQFRFLGQARVEASAKLGPARLIPPTSRLAGAAPTPGPITPGSARKHFMGHVATGNCHLGDHCLDFPLLLEPNKICQRKIFVWFSEVYLENGQGWRLSEGLWRLLPRALFREGFGVRSWDSFFLC